MKFIPNAFNNILEYSFVWKYSDPINIFGLTFILCV